MSRQKRIRKLRRCCRCVNSENLDGAGRRRVLTGWLHRRQPIPPRSGVKAGRGSFSWLRAIFADHSAFCIPVLRSSTAEGGLPSAFAPGWLWWSLGGALVEPWGSLGGALGEPWGGLGVALYSGVYA